jgi:hypothetical protein
MDKEYEIVYHERFDMWILRTGGRQEEDRYWNEGTVLFIGGFQSIEEQIDSLLDLILMNGPKQKYFEEILRRLTT